MTAQQAQSLSSALANRSMPHSIVVSFPSPGVTTYAVQLDPAYTFLGPDLSALVNYCTVNGLVLSMRVQQMGIT